MPQITVLDQNTINQIAAGEVIDRPSSIVKELVENAIDAGSTAVTVEIKEGGISYIRITDNGCGIPKEEIATAFLRHSTSKIRSAEDLLKISSLGFRGEALSSIAAISQVEVITKPKASLTGISYRIYGGEVQGQEEIGCPDGTTFLVRNVFFNTPARKKFLKSSTTEGNYIADLMDKIAVSHPEVSFCFISNGQTKLYTSGNGKLKDVIYTVYGREITANLLPIDRESYDIHIFGFLGKPVIARGNRVFENYYINGRYIKSKILSKAIEDAYKAFMMQHRYPFCVLNIQVPMEMVDVNVHPSKMEVRFRNESLVYQCVYDMIHSVLAGREFIPEVELIAREDQVKMPENVPEPFEKKRSETDLLKNLASYGVEKKAPKFVRESSNAYGSPVGNPAENPKPSMNFSKQESAKIGLRYNKEAAAALGIEFTESKTEKELPWETPKAETEIAAKPVRKEAALPQKMEEQPLVGEQMELFDGKLLSKEARASHRLIGQLFSTYWLIQFEDKLFIMDQHAAHEKVLYERTIKRFKESVMTSQQVSPPEIITLSPKEEEILAKYRKDIETMGYEVSYFGGKEYAISAVPADIFGANPKGLLFDLLTDLSDLPDRAAPDRICDRIATASCKAAVKGNQAMQAAEADALIEELLTLENPYACPHGRPTIISMSKYEIEKKFKRIV